MFKKIISSVLLSTAAFSTMGANAAVPGVYVSGQLGYADTHMKNKVSYVWDKDKASIKLDALSNSGLTGRFALGYQFNSYFALEAGYLNVLSSKGYTGSLPNNLTDRYKFQLSQDALDVNAKAIFPINDQLNFYAKAGAAYLTSSLDTHDTSQSKQHTDLPSNIPSRNWAPEAAIGISYDINPNLPIDFSWTHIQPIGNKNKDKLGNIDFVAVGIGYNFG